MRTIHVLRVEGINGSRMRSIFDRFLEMIHNTPVNQKSRKNGQILIYSLIVVLRLSSLDYENMDFQK